MNDTVTKSIADYALHPVHAQDAAETRANASAAFVDTVGVMLAGVPEESARIARDLAAAQFASAPSGMSSTVAGENLRPSPVGAALANGVAAHALDYDDVSPALRGHASGVVLPALFSLAENMAVTGQELVDAYVVGVDIAGAIATAIDIDSHYEVGWHPTSTIAPLGAIAAGSRLARLTAKQTASALSIGASLVGGVRANFGTMTKHLHAGIGASHAVLAIELTRAGFTAAVDAVAGRNGFLGAVGAPGGAGEAISAALVSGFGAFANSVDVKKYPSCYQTNRMIDALIALSPSVPTLDAIRAISVTVEPGGSAALLRGRADTVAEARFCPEFLAAAALSRRTVDFATFARSTMHDPAIRRLMPKVRVVEAATPSFGSPVWQDGFADIVIETDNGTLRGRCDVAHGDHKDRLSTQEQRHKFADNLDRSTTGLDGELLFAQWSRVTSADDAGALIRGLAGA